MIIMTFILGRTVEIGIETTAMGREIWLNAEYSKDKWEFIAEGQGGQSPPLTKRVFN